MNKVVLIGRLTRDPELKLASTGVDVCSFSIAVSKHNANNDVDFIDCVAFKINAANLVKYQKKGDLICVDGTLQVRSYQAQDGSTRKVTEVVANRIVFLSPVSDAKKAVSSPNPWTDPVAFDSSKIPESASPFSFSDDDLPY